MQRRGERPLPVGVLGGAGKVVRVRLHHRHRHPGRPLGVELGHRVAARLEPGPVERGGGGRRLAADGGRHPGQCPGRRRPSEHPDVEVVGADDQPVHLRVCLRRQLEPAVLVVVDEDAVARGREQPGHREVRGVGAQTESGVRHHAGHEDGLALGVRTVEHPVLDRSAAVVDPVGPLPQPEVALALRRAQVDRRAGDPVAVTGDCDGVRPVSGGTDLHADRQRGDRRPQLHHAVLHRDHMVGRHPAVGGPQRDRVAADRREHGAVTIDEPHRPVPADRGRDDRRESPRAAALD